jgi:acetyl-CoA carboxylase biotin carboxyl carrier protein
MDLRKLKTLIDLVAESGISELEMSEGEEKVRIVNHRQVHSQPVQEVYIPSVNPQPRPDHNQTPPPIALTAADISPVTPVGNVMKSPMVGTFYRAANPESPAFVNVGDSVKVGQTLCIIEAMKLLNEIESEFEGVVLQILVENSQGVEFDQPLFVIG